MFLDQIPQGMGMAERSGLLWSSSGHAWGQDSPLRPKMPMPGDIIEPQWTPSNVYTWRPSLPSPPGIPIMYI